MTDADFRSLSDFSCGVSVLDEFFRNEVAQWVRHHYLAAYCVTLGRGEIVGAFTLINYALIVSSESEKTDFFDDLRLEMDDENISFYELHSSYPAINIGHLGIKVDYQRRGIGTSIIDLVCTTYADYKQTGCQFVTVDALKDDSTLKFYLRNQFNYQTNKDSYRPTRRMYRILLDEA